MATMYCALCNRPVEAKRQIGAGTIILAVVTGGLWLVTVPFYRKRCAICKSDAVTQKGPGERTLATAATARVTALEERLVSSEVELETTREELDRLRKERDIYRDLLGDRVHERGRGS